MRYNFDAINDRINSDSIKWSRYGKDVIPLWVADMDFVSPEPVVNALQERLVQRIFGYPLRSNELAELICDYLKKKQNWQVSPSEVIYLPGLVAGFNYAVQSFTLPGQGVLVQPPIYYPILLNPVNHRRVLNAAPLVQNGNSYEIDFDALEAAINSQTRLFILCNPHNPVGRVFSRIELERMAEICLRRGLIICSDEIHCDLILGGKKHISIAGLSPEIARNTVTLISPSKTFNITGLHFGAAIIQEVELIKRWKEATIGLNPGVNILGQAAAIAAYRNGGEWLGQVLQYLRGNLAFLKSFIKQSIPAIKTTELDATYLAWLDCRALQLAEKPGEFFLRQAKVALSEGSDFGLGGEGFARLNFACPRSILQQALVRMSKAVTG